MDQQQYALWNSGAPREYLAELSDEDMLVAAEGIRVRDVSGRWYLDARSGLWNVALGYSNKRVTEAIKQQLDRLPFGNIYGRPTLSAHQCSKALSALLPEGVNWVRFSSNGAQAVDNAVLLSRFLRRVTGAAERTAVFALWHGFHGLGPGAGAISGVPYLHHHTGQLMPDTHHASGPFQSDGGCGSQLERMVSDFGPERVTAVIIEPVVGEGGHVLSHEYLHSLERFCRGHDIHLIFDEIVTGMGRVGAVTRAEQIGVVPDMLLLGKGITSGYVPLSVVAIHERVYRLLHDHASAARALGIGSTSDGHPLATAAALAVMEVLTEGGVLDNVGARATSLFGRLGKLRDRHPGLVSINGVGLMCGLGFDELAGRPWTAAESRALRLAAERRGVLISNLRTAPQVMLMPPLIVTEDEVEEIVQAIDGALQDLT